MIAGLEEITAGTIADRRARWSTTLAARGARRRDGVPDLRALSAHDRAREPRLRSRDRAAARRPRSTRASREAARHAAARRAARPQATRSSRAASASASRWGGRSCASPTVFLFDEPLSNLDADAAGRTCAPRSRAARAARQRRSIYVTHDQVEAMTLADRIVVMHGGHVEQVGTPLRALPSPGQSSSSPASSARRA